MNYEDFPTTCGECDKESKDCVCPRDDDYEMPIDDEDEYDFIHDDDDDVSESGDDE